MAGERLQDRRSALDESYGYAETEKGGRSTRPRAKTGGRSTRSRAAGGAAPNTGDAKDGDAALRFPRSPAAGEMSHREQWLRIEDRRILQQLAIAKS